MARTVCVTGGLGFIGSRLCTVLADAGHRVVSVDRLSASYAAGTGPEAARMLAARPNVEVVVADASTGRLERLLPGVDSIVHLAALPGVRTHHGFTELWRENVMLTERLVELAVRNGLRMVFGSSSSVYGNAAQQPTPEHAPLAPLSPYAASKVAGENACIAAARRWGADLTVVRLFTVFGPGQRPDMVVARWIDALRRGTPIDWHVHRGGARELTHVDDAVRGLIAALGRGRPGEAYNVGGCGSHRLEDVLRMIEAEVGRRAHRNRSSPPTFDPVRTEACTEKSALELGYRAAVGLEAGIRSQVRASERTAGTSEHPARLVEVAAAGGRGRALTALRQPKVAASLSASDGTRTRDLRRDRPAL